MKNYYKILGVHDFASSGEIKAAYRKLAKEFHPDRNFGDARYEDRFKEISEAYAVLSDDEKRRKYDLKLKYGTHTFHAAPKEKTYSRYRQPKTADEKPGKKKFWDFERHQVAISALVALALIWAVVHFSSKENVPIRPRQDEPLPRPADSAVKTLRAKKIRTSDSPYDSFFGEGVYDTYSKNSLIFNNSDLADAMVLLVNDRTGAVIRNEFISAGNIYRMTNIPDGKYFLKICFGKGWNPEKTFVGVDIRGGFDSGTACIKKYYGKELLEITSRVSGNRLSYSTIEIKLFPDDAVSSKTISPLEFFHRQ